MFMHVIKYDFSPVNLSYINLICNSDKEPRRMGRASSMPPLQFCFLFVFVRFALQANLLGLTCI